MLFKYYNGNDYGSFTTDPIDLFMTASQSQTNKFFKLILLKTEEQCEIAEILIGEIIDKLSEIQTLYDIMEASGTATKTELNKASRIIKRLEKAKKLCEEVAS